MERKMVTQDWAKRINISILSICIVDTWLSHSGIIEVNTEWHNDFYGYLTEELIDNSYDETGGRSRSEVIPSRMLINDLGTSPLIQNDVSGRCGLSIYLTPTKRKIHDNRGNYSANILQRRCSLCRFKTAWCCNKCKDDVCLRNSIFCVIQNQRKSALQHMSKHVY